MCEKGKDFEVYTHNEYECWRTPPGNFEKTRFRYLLKKNPLIIIGCNPSTANEKRLDPTMEIVSHFCHRNGYGGYIMLNLYPQIASKVDRLPKDIDKFKSEINNMNIKIIEKTIRENNNLDILFAFGKLIEKRNYLYDKCYVDIIKSIKNLIENNVIDINQIKKISERNIKNNKIKKFDYPPHFLNPSFNKSDVERIIDPEPFDFENYKIELAKKKSKSSKQKNSNPKKA